MKNLCSILVVLTVACIPVSSCTSMPVLSFTTGGKVKLAHGGDMYSFRLVKLQEMKNATHMVVQNSTQMHKYECQSNDFTVGKTVTVNATAAAPEFQGTVLKAIVAPVGNVTISILAIFARGSGTITFEDEIITVTKAGQASVEFEVKDWPFCHPSTNECNNNGVLETGEFLEATVEVASPGHISVNQSTLTVKLGNAEMTYSDQIFVDDILQALDTGYPKVFVMTNKLHMIIRIPKFDSKANYGTLNVNVDTNGAAGKVASGIASLLAVFVAVLIC